VFAIADTDSSGDGLGARGETITPAPSRHPGRDARVTTTLLPRRESGTMGPGQHRSVSVSQ
jgi:hypothetical protein